MKPNTKSLFFKLSILCFVAFFIQLIFLREYARGVVENDNGTEALSQVVYWLGVIWISLGSLFWYKSTRNKQAFLNQFLVFILSPITFSPIIGISYVVIVLLPLYSLVGESLN